MMKFFYFAPLALFLFIAIYFANGLSRDAGYMPSMLIDQPVPEFDLPPILGRDAGLSSADLKGEVVMVNVFGSWCVGCKIEHPQLLAIASEGIVPIHGLDWKDKPGTGAAWLADQLSALPVASLAGWPAAWLAWLAGSLSTWLAGLLPGWLACCLKTGWPAACCLVCGDAMER